MFLQGLALKHVTGSHAVMRSSPVSGSTTQRNKVFIMSHLSHTSSPPGGRTCSRISRAITGCYTLNDRLCARCSNVCLAVSLELNKPCWLLLERKMLQ